MKISKVVYKWYDPDLKLNKALVVCDITLENSLKLSDVRLYKNENGYFLVFPSKQDIYQTIQQLNPDVELNLPEPENGSDRKKGFEEFFFPVDSAFYRYLLSSIVDGINILGYDFIKKNGCSKYYPSNGGCKNVKKEGSNT